MNHSYRVVFNESTNTYTAVAEIAKARGKKSKSSKAAAVVAVGLSLGFASNAFAAQTTVQGTKNVVEASGTAVYGNYNAVAGIGAQMIVVGNSNDVGGKAKVRSTAETVGGFEIDPSAGLTETDSATSNSRNTVVIGNVNTVTNSASAVVLGRGITMTNADRAISMGLRSSVTQADAVALGSFAKATGEDSLAMGSYALAAKNGSLAIGSNSNVTGNQSISVGVGNQVSGSQSGAFGNNNQIGATATYVDGKLQTVSGLTDTATVENSRAVGNKNYINTSNTYVLGSGVGTKDDGTVLGTVENSVYLGNDSTVAKGAAVGTKNLTKEGAEGTTTTAGDVGTVDTATVAGVTYGSFAGKTAAGAVSVGSAGLERRVMNVAAGEISATSTDAINGSQLYMVAKGTLEQMPVVYTDTDGNKVVKQPDGTFINPKTNEVVAPENVIASMNNPNGKTNNAPMTLTNIEGNLDGAKTDTTAPTTVGTAPANVADISNNAATVGDVLNAGWNLKHSTGGATPTVTEKDFVRAFDNVVFANGEGTTASVEVTDEGKTSTIKYDVNVDGDTITTKTDPNDPTKTVITANTTSLTNTDGKVNTPVAPTALVTAQTVANAINNSGWKLAAEGTEGTELISPSDTATFKVGNSNLTVKRENSDITYDLAKDINVNSVQFNENGPKITNDGDNIKVGDKDGKPTKITNVADGDISPVSTDVINGKQLNNYAKVNGQNVNTTPDGSINIVNGNGTTVSTNQEGEIAVNIGETGLTVSNGSQTNADGSVAADGTLVVQDPNGSGANFVNATNLAKAVNNVSWKVDSEKDETTANAATKNTYTADNNKVKAGDTVKVNAGRNVEISGSGKNINVAVSDNPEFDTVKVGKGDNATTISSNQEGLRVAKADGSAQRITNVRAGVADTDAVNVSQLKGAVNHLDNKINRNNRNLRAGIAGANAAAGLPQVYIPGKSMVAASAGTFKGESALAVGYSRASDNGKVILKLQGNANTRGDVGASVGVGYQW